MGRNRRGERRALLGRFSAFAPGFGYASAVAVAVGARSRGMAAFAF
jgi:hypothetical protein